MGRGLDRKSNPELIALIQRLRVAGGAGGAPIWRDIASRLEKPASRWPEVNVGKLSDVVRDGETAVVPGKILAQGDVARKLRVAAFRFSEGAREKITAAGGQCLTLSELVASNAKGAKCRIVG